MGLAQAFISCPAEGVVIEGRCRLCAGVLKPLDSRGLLIIGCHSPARPPWKVSRITSVRPKSSTPHKFTSDTSCFQLQYFAKQKQYFNDFSTMAICRHEEFEIAMNSRQISWRKLHLLLFVYVCLPSRIVVLFFSLIACRKVFCLFLRPF